MWQKIGRFVKEFFRSPYDFLKVRFLPDWARDSTILLIMQTVDNRMRLKRGRSLYTLLRRGLVSERDRSLPIPAVINAGRQVVERFAAKIDGIPQSTINEVLLDTPSTAHILGGCGIGADETTGVIDSNHEAIQLSRPIRDGWLGHSGQSGGQPQPDHHRHGRAGHEPHSGERSALFSSR
jgi:hypothetical protein